MTALTPNRGYPYPEPTDPVDIPGDIEALAEAVNDDVQANLVPVIGPRPLTHIAALEPQAVVGDSFEAIRFQAVYIDTTGMANLTQRPTALVVQEPGLYVFHARLTVETAIVWNTVYVRILQNNVTVSEHRQAYRVSGLGNITIATTAIVPCAAGDVFEAGVNSFPDQTFTGERNFAAWRMAS